MAGDWLKFELITLDKPEVCQIAEYAGIDIDAVIGKLLRVWGWFDQLTESGNAPSVSKKLLDRLVGVPGFCEFMIQVGWMIETDDDTGRRISLPNFDRHNGTTAKQRLLTARRVAKHKVSGEKTNAKGNGVSVTSALPREDVDVEEDQHNSPPAHDSLAPFEMTLDWVPEAKTLKAYAMRVGIAVEEFTPEAIGPFVCHYAAKGRIETQASWVSLLVRWFNQDKVVAAAGSKVSALRKAGPAKDSPQPDGPPPPRRVRV